MDKEQKNTDTAKSNIQHQEEALIPQEYDLKKVLKPEVLDL